MSSKKKIALEYAKNSIKCFPLKPNEKIPILKGGFKIATDDPHEIDRLWTKYPNANIGLPTGSVNGFDVIDIDERNGGLESLKLLNLITPDLTYLYSVRTGDGIHIYVKHSPTNKLKNITNFIPGIDFKCCGGYVLGAGSSHPNGATYEVM